MHTFTLQDERVSQATAVPDLFLDYYMPSANGEFVKVYLYLLRAAAAVRSVSVFLRLQISFSAPKRMWSAR